MTSHILFKHENTLAAAKIICHQNYHLNYETTPQQEKETKSSRRGVPETAQDGNTDKESSCEETKERIPRLRVQRSLKFFFTREKN